MSFDVWLIDAGPGTLNVTKVVKTVTGLGLADARALVDQGGVIVADVESAAAEAIRLQLVEAGATVVITAHGETPADGPPPPTQTG